VAKLLADPALTFFRRIRTPARTPAAQSRMVARLASTETEEVAVFCRLRPLASEDGEERCVEVCEDGHSVRVAPPADSARYGLRAALQCRFAGVFDEECGQRRLFHSVGLPLVRNLLLGRNGLLFTYGVTGSGKTHTMQGSAGDGGVMTRAVDVVFNSIEGRQTSAKFVVESDKLNDFQILSVADAAAKRQREMINDVKTRAYTTRR